MSLELMSNHFGRFILNVQTVFALGPKTQDKILQYALQILGSFYNIRLYIHELQLRMSN